MKKTFPYLLAFLMALWSPAKGFSLEITHVSGCAEVDTDYQCVEIASCQDLTQSNTYYLLADDIVTGGTCFTNHVSNIHLDLNSYTVSYAQTEPGHAFYEQWSNRDNVTIENGFMIGGYQNNSHALYWVTDGSDNLVIRNLSLSVAGVETSGIKIGTGNNLEIHHVNIEMDSDKADPCSHYGEPIAGISLAHRGGDIDIHHNFVTGTGMTGIVTSSCGTYTEPLEIHNNYISTWSPVRDGYAIGISGTNNSCSDGTLIYDNTINQQNGRGIIVDGWTGNESYGPGNIEMYGNHITVKEGWDCEYDRPGTAAGIRLRFGAHDVYAHDNEIYGLAGTGVAVGSEPGKDGATAIGIYSGSSLPYGLNNRFENNYVEVSTNDARYPAIGLYVAGGDQNTSAAFSQFLNNTIVSNNKPIRIGYSDGGGSQADFDSNTIVRGDNPLDFHTYTVGYWIFGAHHIDFLDSIVEGGASAQDIVFDSACEGSCANYENITLSWTLNLQVENSGANRIEGASVQITDSDNQIVAQGQTDAQGLFSQTLVEKSFEGILQPDEFIHTPHEIQIEKAGYQTYSDSLVMDSTKTVIVNLQEGSSNQAPILEPLTEWSVFTGESIEILVSAIDPDNDPIELSASTLPSGAQFLDYANGTGIFSWIPSVDGLYSISFTASDGYLSDIETLQIAVLAGAPEGNQAPVLSEISDQTGYPFELLTFEVTATDSDDDLLTYWAENLPNGADFMDQTFIWFPDDTQLGTHTITFFVSDGEYTDSQDVTVTIQDSAGCVYPQTYPHPDGSCRVLPHINVAGVSYSNPDTDQEYDWRVEHYDLLLFTFGSYVLDEFIGVKERSPGLVSLRYDNMHSHIMYHDRKMNALDDWIENHPEYGVFEDYFLHYKYDCIQAGIERKGWNPDEDLNVNHIRDGYEANPQTDPIDPNRSADFKHESRIMTRYNRTDRVFANVGHAGYQAFNAQFSYDEVHTADVPSIGYDFDGMFVDNTNTYAFMWDSVPDNEVLEYPDDPQREEDWHEDMVETFAAVKAQLADKKLYINTIYFHLPQYFPVTDGDFKEYVIHGRSSMGGGEPYYMHLARLATEAEQYSVLTVANYTDESGNPLYTFSEDRYKIFTLAQYYLLHSPYTYFNYQVGNTSWNHDLHAQWFEAMGYNIGIPIGDEYIYATDNQPNGQAAVYAREFTNGLVLAKFKPNWVNDFDQPSTHDLGGSYKLLGVDGSLGPVINQITLRNSQAAILIPASSGGENYPPVLQPIGNREVLEGATLNFSVSASDPNGDVLTYTAENIPAGSNFSNQTFTWTPGYDQAGTYSVNFIVSDGELSDSEQIQIAVVDNDPDTQAPSIPQNFTAQALSGVQVQLTWEVSTDNVGVTGYHIYRDGAEVATTTTTSYLDSSLEQLTRYSYEISAYDASGNESALSDAVDVTTPGTTTVEVIGLVREDCSGYSNCYSSLTQWESSYGGVDFGSCPHGDLVCADAVAIAQIDGIWNSPETGRVVIDGWTTDEDHYIKIFTAPEARHDGKWNESKYRLEGSHLWTPILQVSEDYVVIDGLQIFNSATQNQPVGVVIDNRSTLGGDVRIKNNIIRFPKEVLPYQAGITLRIDPQTTVKVLNNIIINPYDGISAAPWSGDKGTYVIYNNTLVDPKRYGIQCAFEGSGQGALLLKNNLVQGINTNYDIYGSSNLNLFEHAANISEDASSPDDALRNKQALFVEEALDDFHLSESDITAKDMGVDLSNNSYAPFDNDIDGENRASLWDIGADEYVSSAVNHPPVLETIDPQEGFIGDPIIFEATATDPDGDVLNYSATGLPAGAIFENQVFSWTPDETQEGQHQITVTVDDGDLDDSQVVSITVVGINDPPILEPIGNKIVNEGEELSFTINAMDPDEDGILLTISTEIPDVVLTDNGNGTADFSWIPGYDQAGSYQATFNAQDEGGLTDQETITIEVYGTNRPPEIDQISDQTINEGEELIFDVMAIDPDDDGILLSMSGLDDASFVDYGDGSGTFSWSPDFTQSGNYQAVFTAQDDGGLSDQVQVSIQVVNVNQPPILDPVGDQSVNEGQFLDITLSAIDPDGETLIYSAADLPQGAALIENQLTWTPTYDQSGSYPVTLRVEDLGGLIDSETITITVDHINRAPILDPIGNHQVAEGNTISITLSAFDPDGDLLNYHVRNEPQGASLIGHVFSWTPGYSDAGNYEVTFSVDDGQLNDIEEIIISVGNINRPPEFDIISPQVVDENQILLFMLSASDPDGDNLIYNSIGLPIGSSFDSATKEFTWTPDYDQAGTHVAEFSVTDGDLSDTLTVEIAVMDVNRTPTLEPLQAEYSVNENEVFIISLDASDPDQDALSLTMQPALEGARIDNQILSWLPSFEQAGVYEVTFTVSDGDLSDQQTTTLIVNNINRAPVFEPIGNQEVEEGESLSIILNASDPDGDDLTFTSSDLPDGSSIGGENGNIFLWSPTHTQSGVYEVTITVTDSQLTGSQMSEITVVNINRAPVLDPIENQSIQEGETLEIQLSGTDPDGDALTYSASNLPEGANFSSASGLFQWTPTFDQNGTYILIFVVSDGELTDSQEATLTVINNNRIPSLDPIGPKEVHENSNLTFQINGSDPDGDSLQFTAKQLPEGANFTNQIFSWTPNYDQEGEYFVTFTVDDGQLSDSEEIFITVYGSNRAPVLDPIGDRTVDEGDLLTFTVTATDPDGHPLTYSASNLPEGATFANQAFSWTPDFGQSGSYEVTFTVMDTSELLILDDSETITITVNDVNRAPVLDPIGNQSIQEGETLEIQLSGTDPDGDVLTYSALGLPEGADFFEDLGLFTWTPTFGEQGIYTLSFILSDGSLTDEESISISVGNVNQPPVLDPIDDQAVLEGEQISIQLAASDPDGQTLIYFAENLPQGADLLSENGLFEWIPGFDQSGEYIVTLGVTDGVLEDTQDVILTITNVNRAPQISPVEQQEVHENQNLSFSITADDPDGDIITYSAQGLPSGAQFTDQTFNWTPDYEQKGTYQVGFTASDGELSGSMTVTIIVYGTNRPPVLSPIHDQIIEEADLLSFDVIGSDPDGNSLSYRASGLPQGAIFENQVFSWIPTYDQAGSYEVTFTVMDTSELMVLEDSETITITVVNVNRAPVLESIPNQEIEEGQQLTFSIAATDPDDDSLTFTAGDLPQGAQFENQIFSWIPANEQVGVHEVTFNVSDGALSDSQTISIVVTEIVIPPENHPPVLDPIGNKEMDEGQQLSFVVTASDPDGDQLMISASHIPFGAQFNEQSGLFEWTPSYEQAGEYQITFIVSDGQLRDSEAITINVRDVNLAPILEPIGDKRVEIRTELSFQVMGLDPDNDSLSYSVNGLPQGAKFKNQLFRWKPSKEQVGQYQLEFFVSDGQLRDSEMIQINVYETNTDPSENQPPILDAIGNKTVAAEDLLRFRIKSIDPDGDLLILVVRDLPAGASMDDDLFQWRPTDDQVGQYFVTFIVTEGVYDESGVLIAADGAYSDQETVKIKVFKGEQPQPRSTENETQILEGESGQDSANGTDGDDLSQTSSYYGGLAYIVSDDNEKQEMTLQQSDKTAKGNSAKSKTRKNNRAPVILTNDQTELEEGTQAVIQVFASDPDQDSLVLSTEELPLGAVFVDRGDGIGEIVWNPYDDQVGEHTINVIVTDGQVQDTKSINFMINKASDAPDEGNLPEESKMRVIKVAPSEEKEESIQDFADQGSLTMTESGKGDKELKATQKITQGPKRWEKANQRSVVPQGIRYRIKEFVGRIIQRFRNNGNQN